MRESCHHTTRACPARHQHAPHGIAYHDMGCHHKKHGKREDGEQGGEGKFRAGQHSVVKNQGWSSADLKSVYEQLRASSAGVFSSFLPFLQSSEQEKHICQHATTLLLRPFQHSPLLRDESIVSRNHPTPFQIQYKSSILVCRGFDTCAPHRPSSNKLFLLLIVLQYHPHVFTNGETRYSS